MNAQATTISRRQHPQIGTIAAHLAAIACEVKRR